MVGFISRTIMYGLILGLALFVAASYFLIDTGNTSTASAREVSVHDLTQQAATFNGKDVSTTGVLSYSAEHGRWQVTDEGNFAIVVRGFSDEVILESLNKKRVRVTGTFGYDSESGTYLDADNVVEVPNTEE